jgi:teichuronic acid biosynthesis glycosyltransferase TuaG
MPAYNAEKFIAQSIESVIKQTYIHWELLIVNDGSTDHTEQIASQYSKNDSRVRLISQPNRKMGAARNAGLRCAKGAWVAFLDSDDLWDPKKLEKQIIASKEYPRVDVIYTDGWIFNDSDLENLDPYPTITGRVIQDREMYNLLYQKNYIPVLSVIAKKTVIDKVGFQDEGKNLQGCEDWDYWIRMALAGSDFYGIPERLFFYRKHGNNISGNSNRMILAQASVFIKNYQRNFFYKKHSMRILERIIFPLLVILLKEQKTEEINYILREVEKLSPSFSYRIVAVLTRIFGHHAFIPVALVGKIKRISSGGFRY